MKRSSLILLLTTTSALNEGDLWIPNGCPMAILRRALQHEPIEPVWSMGGNLSVIFWET